MNRHLRPRCGGFVPSRMINAAPKADAAFGLRLPDGAAPIHTAPYFAVLSLACNTGAQFDCACSRRMTLKHRYPGDPLFRPYPDVKDRKRLIPGFHRASPQASKHLSPARRSEGNYTSLRSVQASGGRKSPSTMSRIHQDPDCAELCTGSALATSQFSPSPTEGASRRNR
jgi:hypothetical protein